jgi:hypothetical protein
VNERKRVHKTEPFKGEAQTALFKEPVRTAQETLFISVIKTIHFTLYWAQVAVCL